MCLEKMKCKFSLKIIQKKNKNIKIFYAGLQRYRTIFQPSILPRNLFSCVAQYKDTDDKYIQIWMDITEDKLAANIY